MTSTNALGGSLTNVPGQITMVSLKCRFVDLTPSSADANTKFMYYLESALTNSPMFLVEGTKLTGNLDKSPDGLTYMFKVDLMLKNPIKLW